MMGCEESDPKLLRTADDLLELLRHIGFLPLFAGSCRFSQAELPVFLLKNAPQHPLGGAVTVNPTRGNGGLRLPDIQRSLTANSLTKGRDSFIGISSPSLPTTEETATISTHCLMKDLYRIAQKESWTYLN